MANDYKPIMSPEQARTLQLFAYALIALVAIGCASVFIFL